MDFFRNTHNTLIESTHPTFKRDLLNNVDRGERLICIKGFRGVGKTTLLLDYIKDQFPDDKTVLYVNLNNFYFTKHTLFGFADVFAKRGGKVLLLDQIQKYPNWSKELRICYDQLPGLQIIFTSSPLLPVEDDNPDLNGIIKVKQLEGLSFREYLNYFTSNEFRSYSFNEIVKNHVRIAEDIINRVRPLAYFNDYLKNGYFPYFIDNPSFYTNQLLKHINLALEIDVPYLTQIELKYLSKLRKLLHIIASETPLAPNISKLASEVETSRATVMNYLRYLKNANLINLLYGNGDDDEMKKPDRIYMQNTNLLYVIAPENANISNLQLTFFYNQVNYKLQVNSSSQGNFLIDNRYHFLVGGNDIDCAGNIFAAVDMIETGNDNKIPLWLFGFLA
ncbi:MAG: AAA family ATPase [Prolixibacteraceae bacterium]|nr:AAA family ATPase [Prolixibacteraceae bacterium]